MAEQLNGNRPEVWLRGPVADVPDALQPVAHALLQAREEIHSFMNKFPDALVWKKPAGLASPAFHLQHIVGVLDRLFGYADNLPLNHSQLKYLSEEGLEQEGITVASLLQSLDRQIDSSLQHLKEADPATLADARSVGRKQLPSTRLGLLFHAAEHTMRHTGQLLVTTRVLLDAL